MPVLSSEIALYRAAVWSSSPASNGGRISAAAIAGVSGALFPNVYEAERVAGSTVYRKAFFKVNNPANLALVDPRLFVHGVAAGDHAVRMALGTATDNEQSFLTTNPEWVGCCKLKNNTANGANSIVVLAESAVPLFRVGGRVLLTSKATPDSGVGVEEIATVQSVVPAGTDITITFEAQLANTYTSATGLACSMWDADTVQASVSAPVVNSTNGTINAASLSANGVGSVEATFTITFSSSTVFSIANNAGLVLSSTAGSTFSTVAPTGPFNSPLFHVQPSFWAGNWQAGDTVQFSTVAAAVPVWFARDIPEASTSTTSSAFSLVMDGESA